MALQRGRHEKDLSTEQSQEETHARIPRADGHARRSRRTEASSGEGSQAVDGNDSAQTAATVSGLKAAPFRFEKSRRLLKREDFLRVQSRGRRRVVDSFVVMILPRADGGVTRLGITASRKVGSAVVRNRAKRLVREFFRRNYPKLPASSDIVVIVRSQPKKKTSYAEVERELSRALFTAF